MEVVRNSISFGESLERKGLTYADVYYRLNGSGITRFNDVLTKSGYLIQNDDGKYLGKKNFHGADNGKRTPGETAVDCEIGNIQETLFCLDNLDFKPNPKATNNEIKLDSEITSKQLDLIHIPTGVQVEFKTSYSKMYGHNAYYRHRDGHIKKFLNSGNILIIYFVNIDKIAVITKKNLEKSFRVLKENEFSENTNKYWDQCSVWDGLMYDYEMMVEGNHIISQKISNIVKQGT